MSIRCNEIKMPAPPLPELVEGGFLIRTIGFECHRVSLHPVLLQVVPLGLWVIAQIIAFAARDKAPPYKSVGQSETESHENSENRGGDF
jgi:hypothetical protein